MMFLPWNLQNNRISTERKSWHRLPNKMGTLKVWSGERIDSFSKNLAKQKIENVKKLEHLVTDFESKSERYSCYTEKQFDDAKDELDKIIQEEKKGVHT